MLSRRVGWIVVASVVTVTQSLWAQGSDSCARAEPISGLGTFEFSTVGASTDGLPANACTFFGSGQIYNDVWFCWTASNDELVSIATCGSGFDTKLAAYLGCDPCPDESTLVACNDDSCGLQSKILFAASAGTSYMLRVGSYNAAVTGSGSLTIASGYLADITNPENGHRYVATEAGSWTSADALATSLNGHLVSITSDAEQQFVWSEFGNLLGVDRRVWIGFNDAGSEGFFGWTSGERASFTNWNAGEPNNAGNNEDYAELLGSNGLWNDLPDSGAGLTHIAVIEFDAGGGGCPGDLNRTGDVDPTDIAILLGAWGTPEADIDGDGTTGPSDLAILLGSWGNCPG